MLFRACDVEKGGVVCQEPVTDLFEDATCVLHIQLPPQRSYSLKKYESESEDDAELLKAAAAAIANGASAASGLIEIKAEPSVVDFGVTSFARPIDIQPSKCIDDLKVEEGETNLTFCHDTSSTTIVVVPKATEEINAQNIATTTTFNETNTMTTNEPISITNTFQPMEVDDKLDLKETELM